MAYVDGFVLAVPTAKKEAYLELAALSAPVFKEYGALSVVECWGDDVPEGKVTSFPMAVQCKENETVVFSWITWPSKEARTKGMEKFMTDERVKDWSPEMMPFDGKRMILGSFETILEA